MLVVVGALLWLGKVLPWMDIEEVLAGAIDSHVHVFVADVMKSYCRPSDPRSGSQKSRPACLVSACVF